MNGNINIQIKKKFCFVTLISKALQENFENKILCKCPLTPNFFFDHIWISFLRVISTFLFFYKCCYQKLLGLHKIRESVNNLLYVHTRIMGFNGVRGIEEDNRVSFILLRTHDDLLFADSCKFITFSRQIKPVVFMNWVL